MKLALTLDEFIDYLLEYESEFGPDTQVVLTADDATREPFIALDQVPGIDDA